MKKKFDCVEMKHKIQEQIHEETKDLSKEERIKYFQEAGAKFRQETAVLRQQRKSKKKAA